MKVTLGGITIERELDLIAVTFDQSTFDDDVYRQALEQMDLTRFDVEFAHEEPNADGTTTTTFRLLEAQ